METKSIHIGERIKSVMKEKNKTAATLAQALGCERTNVYNIFHRKSIDIKLLWSISLALEHNFFKEFSDEVQKSMPF